MDEDCQEELHKITIVKCNRCDINEESEKTNINEEYLIKINQYCKDLYNEWTNKVLPLIKSNSGLNIQYYGNDKSFILDKSREYIKNFQIKNSTMFTIDNEFEFDKSVENNIRGFITELKEHVVINTDNTNSRFKWFKLVDIGNIDDQGGWKRHSPSYYIIRGPKIVFCLRKQTISVILQIIILKGIT